MCVQNFIKRFMSYQQCTRFRTTVDFDREYLWNRSSKRQAENGVINFNFSHVRRKQFGTLWSTNEKMTLTFDLRPRVLEVFKVHVHAQFHRAKFLSYHGHRKKTPTQRILSSLPRTCSNYSGVWAWAVYTLTYDRFIPRKLDTVCTVRRT